MFEPLIDIVAAVQELVGEENLTRRALRNPEVRGIEGSLRTRKESDCHSRCYQLFWGRLKGTAPRARNKSRRF